MSNIQVLLNCLLMLTASGFSWSVLSQNQEFTSMTPRLISAIGFIIIYLVISLLPLCCKVTREEGDLPLHEQMKENTQHGQLDSSPPEDSNSSSLFKTPPGILRSQSTAMHAGVETSGGHLQDPWLEPALPDQLVRACGNP